MKQEWALLEKPLDNTYVQMSLFRVAFWHFGDGFCAPVVCNVHDKQMLTVDRLQLEYGKLIRILDHKQYMKHIVKIVEGHESDFVFNRKIMTTGYRYAT